MHIIFGEWLNAWNLKKYTGNDFDLKEDSISKRFTESKYDCYIQRQRVVALTSHVNKLDSVFCAGPKDAACVTV